MTKFRKLETHWTLGELSLYSLQQPAIILLPIYFNIDEMHRYVIQTRNDAILRYTKRFRNFQLLIPGAIDH